MTIGLPVSRVVSVSITLSPQAAQFANLKTLLIMGDSNVIDTYQRIRAYSAISAVAADFGTSAPEYLAALEYFSQNPAPESLFIGRWAQAATHGSLVGGALTGAEQAMSSWTAITTGSFKANLNGVATDITGLNFASQVNLNGVAAVIQAAVRAIGTGGYTLATVVWDAANARFVISSGTTGTASISAALVAAASGTNISALLKGTAATLSWTVAGVAAETAVAAVAAMDLLTQQWYALTFAAGLNNVDIVDADHLAIAAYVEASAAGGQPHVYGLTTSEATALVAGNSTDVGSELMAAGYTRTFASYSAQNAYLAASMFGRALPVDYAGQNTALTLMWKQMPGVTAELLNVTNANTLDAKRYNYVAQFNNNTSILVNGKMAGPAYIDEIINLDNFANELQTDIYNLLYTTPTKIPQTDAGVHRIITTAEATCQRFVVNGVFAPGQWNSDGFGTLQSGDQLPKGYYVYAQPVALQSVADRGARKSPTIQIAAKEAGAIHTVLVSVLVNQ